MKTILIELCRDFTEIDSRGKGKGMKVIYVFSDSPIEWNCSEWRMHAPSDAINWNAENNPEYTGWSAKMIHITGFLDYLDTTIQNHIAPADIIIVQRNVITTEAIDARRYWIGMGKPVAIDLDDMYQRLPWSNPAHAFWIENSANLDPAPLDMLERGLQTCNALISPNRNLLNDWSHVARGYYLQNYARKEWWLNDVSRHEQKSKLGLENKIVIGWGGSVSHYDSWWGSGLRDAASQICKTYPDVVWMICGSDPRILDQLDVPDRNKYAQPGVYPEFWPDVVKTFDIGVAPLYGMYDQRRSWIKSLEYGLAGTPWIATDGEVYSNFTGYGKLVKGGVTNWFNAISSTIDNLYVLQQKSESLVSYYQQYFAVNQMKTFGKIYSSIIENYKADYGSLPGLNFVNWGKGNE